MVININVSPSLSHNIYKLLIQIEPYGIKLFPKYTITKKKKLNSLK